MTQPGTALALLANRLQVSEQEVKQALTQTVFKGASDAQMTALLVVANEYGLNPFVKELYAFPSQNGIVPMVSIDGWLRIINDHPQFAGMDIVYAEDIAQIDKARPCPEYIEVTIHRNDRPHASSPIREYLDECYRNTVPWNTMTRRMLRHKAIKEAARVTMGLHGIYDEDEASDVLAREGKTIVRAGDTYEVVEVAQDATGEIIGPEDHTALLAEMERTGLDEGAIAKNLAAKAHYTGALEDMPVRVYESLMAGLRSMATWTPKDDTNGGGAPTDTPEDSQPAPETFPQPPLETQPQDDLSDADRIPFGEDPEEPPAQSAPGSAVAAAQRAAESHTERVNNKVVTQKQVNLLFTKCTIHGVDERAELHEWLAENLGVEHVSDIPAARFDQVLAWVQGHEKGGKAA